MLSLRKKFDKNLASVVQLLKLAEHIAESTSVPFIKGIFGTAVFIAETAQKVQSNKEECQLLAQRAADLALGLNQQLLENKSRLQTVYMQNNLSRLNKTLEEIKDFMILQTSRSWFNGLKNMDEVDSQVRLYANKLDDAARLFQIGSLINMEDLILKLTAELEHSTAKQQEAMCTAFLELGAKFDVSTDRDIDGIKLFWTTDIYLEADSTSVENTPTSRKNYRGHLNGKAVVVRHYIVDKDFENDLKRLIWLGKFFHPNIEQFLGRSHQQSKHKFLVVRSGVKSALDYVKVSVGRARIILAAHVLTQIYSGVTYWEENLSHLQWQGRESQVLLDENGQVFLGEIDARLRPASKYWTSATHARLLLGRDPSEQSLFNRSNQAARHMYRIWKDFSDGLDSLHQHDQTTLISTAKRDHLISLWLAVVREARSWRPMDVDLMMSADTAVHIGDISYWTPSGHLQKVDAIVDGSDEPSMIVQSFRLCKNFWQDMEASCIEAAIEGEKTKYTLYPKGTDNGFLLTHVKTQGPITGPPNETFLEFARRVFALADSLGKNPYDFVLVTKVAYGLESELRWDVQHHNPEIVRYYGNHSDREVQSWCVCRTEIPTETVPIEDCQCVREMQPPFKLDSRRYTMVYYTQLTRDECLFLKSIGWPSAEEPLESDWELTPTPVEGRVPEFLMANTFGTRCLKR